MIRNELKILMIDDHPGNNFLTKEIIQILNANTTLHFKAELDVESAIQFLVDHEENFFPDLIFIDMMMPGLDGFDFIKMYEERFYLDHADTIMFMLSSFRKNELMLEAKKYGSIKDYILKDNMYNKLKVLLPKYFPQFEVNNKV